MSSATGIFIFPAMDWDIDSARRQYNIPGWSAGYFDVGSNGHLVVRPGGDPDAPAIDLHGLVERLHKEGLTLVVVTHDPAVARRADRVLVLVDGNIVRRVPGPELTGAHLLASGAES